jgi:hypothetical protein
MSSVRETILSMFYEYYNKASLGLNLSRTPEGSIDNEMVLFHSSVAEMELGDYAAAVLKYNDDGVVLKTKFGVIVLIIVQPGSEVTRRVAYYCLPSFSKAAALSDFPCSHNVFPVESVVEGNAIQFGRVQSVEMMDRILSCLDGEATPV